MKNLTCFCLIGGLLLMGQGYTASDNSALSQEFEEIAGSIQRKKQEQGIDDSDHIAITKTRKSFLLSNIDSISEREYSDYTDAYLEGYIQALVDVHYYEFNVVVIVKNRHVTLYNLPKNALLTNSILTFVKHLPEVRSVQKGTTKIADKRAEQQEMHMVREQVNGIWFPQSSVLFQPLIADLYDPVYSVGYRFNDDVMGKHVIGVSFGDTFPIFRWRNVLPWKGDLQIDIQAGVWADFNMGHNDNPNGEWSELVTTDYLVGIPLSYAINKWSYRLRVYHISSHLGDEYMRNNPEVVRLNPSMEALDFFSSYQVTKGIRLYFGPGWIFHSDKTFPLKPFYVEYGTEMRFFGRRDYYHMIYGTPFLAVNVRNWQQHHWQFNVTAQLGYEWSKLQGVGRKVRLFAQYYHGYSVGQFFNDRTDYFSIRFSYGF